MQTPNVRSLPNNMHLHKSNLHTVTPSQHLPPTNATKAAVNTKSNTGPARVVGLSCLYSFLRWLRWQHEDDDGSTTERRLEADSAEWTMAGTLRCTGGRGGGMDRARGGRHTPATTHHPPPPMPPLQSRPSWLQPTLPPHQLQGWLLV